MNNLSLGPAGMCVLLVAVVLRSPSDVCASLNDDDLSRQHNVYEYNSDFTMPPDDGGDDEENRMGKRFGRSRNERDRPLPLLLARVGGNIRKRKSFLNAVTCFGIPPQDAFNSQWLVHDLRDKSEKCFRAYIALFMSHLCEPGNENTETFAHGVPREGLCRKHVLTRIGVSSLIRKKVHEFEAINGKHSLPHLAAKLVAESIRMRSNTGSEATNTPQSGTPASSARASPTPKKKEASEETTSASASDSSKTAVNKSEDDAKDDTEKDEDKKNKPTEPAVEKPPVKEEEAKESREAHGNRDVPKKDDESKENSVDEAKDRKLQKFMFDIADGGFTELHTLWQNEERAAVPGREFEIWHRRHDYWLLALALEGIVTRGLGRWQDIQTDLRFAIINEPFKMDVSKGTFIEIKNKFLARWLKLLKQALVIKEQPRRPAYLNLTQDSNHQALALYTRFTEVEYLAESHQYPSKESLAGSKPAISQQQSDIGQGVSRLPASPARIPPVAQGLQMSERSILFRLVTSQAEGGAADYAGGQLVGAFGANLAQFRPQYSVPDQGAAFPGSKPQTNIK